MKKIAALFFVLFMIFVLHVFNNNVTATVADTIIANYGELPNYNEYVEQSSQYVFDSNVNMDLILSALVLAEIEPDSAIMDFVYSVFDQIQYLIIESTISNKYCIYDLMLEEVIEYSTSNHSIWYTNNKMNCIKVYFNPSSIYHIDSGYLYNTFTNDLIDEIDDSVYENIHYDSSNYIMTSTDLEPFKNRVIRFKYDIEHSEYFKFFNAMRTSDNLDDNPIHYAQSFEYNNSKSCTIVADTMLLGYFDTFYNDNVIPDGNISLITAYYYENDVLDEGNHVIFNSGYYQFSSQSKSLNREITTGTDDAKLCQKMTEPSEFLHDHLYYLGHNIHNQISFVPTDLFDINYSYLTSRGLSSSFQSYYYLFDYDIFSQLDDDIPVILGYFGHDFYYNYDPETNSVLGKINSTASHTVLVYGYEETNIGTLYHVNMGWETQYNNTYLNAHLVGEYYWMEYNGTHVHSANYKHYFAKYVTTGYVSFSFCPTCYSFDDFFTYYYDNPFGTSVDFFIHNDSSEVIMLMHKYTLGDYEIHNSSNHYRKCHYCGIYEVNDLGNIKEHPHKYMIYYSLNTTNHHKECIDCGYNCAEQHNTYYYPKNNTYCNVYCSICKEYYNEILHNFEYHGTQYNHYKECSRCHKQIECESPNYGTPISRDDRYHKYTCDCGYEHIEQHNLSSNICTICGYVHNNHDFLYSQFNSMKHLRYCYCGTSNYQAHTYVDYHGILKCIYCGYENDGFVPINSGNPTPNFINNFIIIYNVDLNYLLEDKDNE